MKKKLLSGKIFRINQNHGLGYTYKIQEIIHANGNYTQIASNYKGNGFNETKNVTINKTNIEIFTYFGGVLLSHKFNFSRIEFI